MTTTRFDQILIDPTGANLAQALAEAVATANHAAEICGAPAACQIVPAVGDLPAAAAAWARLPQRRPHGAKRWAGQRVDDFVVAEVAMAWWTDAIGRRHVRVRSLASLELPPLLPRLVEVYPDRAVIRRRGDLVDVRVICSCGQAGDPVRLGWMGEHCGPCHDRQQEGHSLPADVFRVPEDARTGNDVGFIPAVGQRTGLDSTPSLGGARTLLVSHPTVVRCWDLNSGAQRVVWRTNKRGCHDLLPLPDGQRVVVEERRSGMVVIRDLATGKRKRLAQDCGRYFSMALSGDQGKLLVGGDQPRCIDLRTGAESWLTGLPAQPLGHRRAVAFTADGQNALVATETGSILVGDILGGELTALTQAPVERGNAIGMAEFSANGRRLVFSRWNDKRVFHVWLAEEGWRTMRRDRRRRRCWSTMTPDGSTVLLVEYTGRIEFWDPVQTRCLGSLLGAPHVTNFSPTALTFSPDGSTLALATGDGAIRLWPWRQLLEG